MQIGQMAKIILEDQQRSFPTIEELIREEMDAKEFNELVAKEELTSLEPKEKISLISEVDETILELIKIGRKSSQDEENS